MGDIKLKMVLNGINKVLGDAGGNFRFGLPVREYYLKPVKCSNNTQLRDDNVWFVCFGSRSRHSCEAAQVFDYLH